MDCYSSYYTSHKNGPDYGSSHANRHMHGTSSKFCLPPEPGIANLGFAGNLSCTQTAGKYGTNQFHDQNVDPGLEDIHNEPRGLSILRNATHQMLMDSGNMEYACIYSEQHEFLGKILKLEMHIEFLEEHQQKREKQFMDTITNMSSKHSTPGKAGFAGRREEALRTAFPLAYKSEDELSGIVDPIGDDSGLNFWATGSFKPGREYPGKIAKRLRFLEDENGEQMTQKRLDVIRRFLSGAFKELKELMYELLPKRGWATSADHELMARCHLELARRFLELSYCQDRWKSHSLMVEWFPSFQRNHMPDAEIHNTVKLEDAEEEEDDEAPGHFSPSQRIAKSSKLHEKDEERPD
ncbi:hypothetical protein APHAL10511_000885 [Amanita phalloides]|nr:hypothetical protein APHAL10511_000885 [Amanita phalloides]